MLSIIKIEHEEQLGFNFYTLTFSNGDRLKVDFSYFPSERIERGIIWHGLHIDTIHLARQFLRVVEFEDLPNMLVPFDRKDMDDFFLKLAKSLEKDIFK